MEFKKLIEVKQDGEKMFTATGYDEEIQTPVEVSFVVDLSGFEKFRAATSYYKWNLHEALTFFCSHADFFLAEMEGIAEGVIKYQEEPWIKEGF